MKVTCPICKEEWSWNGESLLMSDGKSYYPNPTYTGKCTCANCHVQPVPKHRSPCGGLTNHLGDPSPWQENAVRALES